MQKINISSFTKNDLTHTVTNFRSALEAKDIHLGLNQARDVLAKSFGASNWKSLESAVSPNNSDAKVFTFTHIIQESWDDIVTHSWTAANKERMWDKVAHDIISDGDYEEIHIDLEDGLRTITEEDEWENFTIPNLRNAFLNALDFSAFNKYVTMEVVNKEFSAWVDDYIKQIFEEAIKISDLDSRLDMLIEAIQEVPTSLSSEFLVNYYFARYGDQESFKIEENLL